MSCFPNLCQDPFNGPLVWKYGSLQNNAEFWSVEVKNETSETDLKSEKIKDYMLCCNS